MPELPEVETVRKTLSSLVVGKTIADIEIGWPKMIKEPDDVSVFRDQVIGQTIVDIERTGKFLRFILTDYVLVSHLRMEGKYNTSNDEVDKHTHVRFFFTDETELRYRDVRKFGTMHLFVKGTEFDRAPLNKVGPEPFNERYTVSYLHEKFQRTTRSIKAVLLDQAIVAGLGNIYVDEALHRSGVLPGRVANTLRQDEIQRLHKETIQTLEEAIASGGSSIRSYLNGNGEMGYFQQKLFVYGRKNEPCKTCEGTIIRSVVAGRGTHYCPDCQS
ncbi:DNA-formamidopyrimidine glycosylase [Geomicrobium sp. JCM 19038]|uniref:DNA-formamidopyrimidine glycosylase n=1 Tax=Geomicrobium sp. JCM 19038 TaxID=1460635 RepID=UPI00045F3920|nr:DNA-formamidopyrimidine glycosylase [Geomicrobium sp. JCM 19038]GAK09705.1 formamidopyrimidine-DNA glycosylase [Geomicrobium sp. JCM 19038]